MVAERGRKLCPTIRSEVFALAFHLGLLFAGSDSGGGWRRKLGVGVEDVFDTRGDGELTRFGLGEVRGIDDFLG